MKLWIAALALMSYACCSYALVIEGRVVAVTDGDTVRLLSVSNVEYKVRLSGIDAPENGTVLADIKVAFTNSIYY